MKNKIICSLTLNTLLSIILFVSTAFPKEISNEITVITNKLNDNLSEREKLSREINKWNMYSISQKMQIQIDSMVNLKDIPVMINYDYSSLKKNKKKSRNWLIGGFVYWGIGALVKGADDSEEKQKDAKLVMDIGLAWMGIAGSFYSYYQVNETYKRYKQNRAKNAIEDVRGKNRVIEANNINLFKENKKIINVQRKIKYDSLNFSFNEMVKTYYNNIESFHDDYTPISVTSIGVLNSSFKELLTTENKLYRIDEIGQSVEVDSIYGRIINDKLDFDTIVVKVSKPFSGWISNKYISKLTAKKMKLYVKNAEAILFADTNYKEIDIINRGDEITRIAEFENYMVVQANYYNHNLKKFVLEPGVLQKQEVSEIQPPNSIYNSEVWIKEMEYKLREGPGDSYGVVAELTKGQKLKLKKLYDNWAYVVLNNSKLSGWVHVSGINYRLVKEPKSIWMKKQVGISAYIETVSLSPIDYRIITSLRNKSQNKLKVKYEISAINYLTPSIFVSVDEFEHTLNARDSESYYYRPSEEIQDLRDAIIVKGLGSNPGSLSSHNFEVRTKIIDVIIFK